MPIELHIMSEEPPVEKLKLAIVGKEKHGKSRLSATGRKVVLNHDFDNRAEALQGMKGVVVASYVDPQWPNQPDAAPKFLDVVGRLEETLDLHDFGDLIKGADKLPKGTIVKTNVVDSIQTMGKAFQNYALFGQGSLRREISIGKMKVFLPGGWDAWNAEMTPVENTILRLLALPTDTILILHETPEETEDSTPDKKKFTGKIGVYPARYQRLLKYVNELWRVQLTASISKNTNKQVYTPKVYPLPDHKFDAATTMFLDPFEEPNIEELILKHRRIAAQKGLLSQTTLQSDAKVLPMTASKDVKL